MVAAGLSGALLGACGSQPAATKPVQKASPPVPSSPGPSSPQGSSPATPGSAADLGKLAASVQAESAKTFRLEYSSTGGPSGQQDVVLEQLPPKQLFRVPSGEVIFDGSRTYFCNTASSAPSCMETSTMGNPFSGMMAAYSGARYAEAMRGWQAQVASGVAGYHLSFSNASFAGQASRCVQWSYQASTAKYCVTDSGVLAYVGSGSAGTPTLELIRYSRHVSPADFDLPKGALIEGG